MNRQAGSDHEESYSEPRSFDFICDGECYDLNVCVPLEFICRELNAQGGNIKKWSLWEAIRS